MPHGYSLSRWQWLVIVIHSNLVKGMHMWTAVSPGVHKHNRTHCMWITWTTFPSNSFTHLCSAAGRYLSNSVQERFCFFSNEQCWNAQDAKHLSGLHLAAWTGHPILLASCFRLFGAASISQCSFHRHGVVNLWRPIQCPWHGSVPRCRFVCAHAPTCKLFFIGTYISFVAVQLLLYILAPAFT